MSRLESKMCFVMDVRCVGLVWMQLAMCTQTNRPRKMEVKSAGLSWTCVLRIQGTEPRLHAMLLFARMRKGEDARACESLRGPARAAEGARGLGCECVSKKE